MPSPELNSIIAELEESELNLKIQVEKLFGKIESTDFSDEYASLQDVLKRLKGLVNSWNTNTDKEVA